jgi:ABC-2 type transport system ATP-binding protein
MTSHAIEVAGLGKHYGGRPAVEDVTFSVPYGTVVGLLGPNGAGKTTVMKAIAGLIRPTTGTARIASADGCRKAPAQLLGFALDPPGMDAGHRATRHLELAAVMAGVPRERVEEVILTYSLQECASRRVRTLSTGQRQRLALATAQLASPEILMLDEPTNGLDAEGVRWLRGALRRHADSGGAVLVSSHMLFELQQLVDEVVVLQRRVRYAGPLPALIHDGERSLEEAYFELLEGRHGIAA